MNKLTFVSTLALFALALTAPVQAETVNCTAITSLPYTISAPGAYCLTGHLSTVISAGSAIAIQANNVVLDLNGFSIDGRGAGLATVANGIFANGIQNITLKNGALRGFLCGICFLSGFRHTSRGHVIEDIRVEQGTSYGMQIFGRYSIIRNNQVLDIGGTTALGADPFTYGIYAVGAGVRLLNNDVIDISAQGQGAAYGIRLVDSPHSVVAGNRISNLNGHHSGESGYSLMMNESTNLIVRDNSVSGAKRGLILEAPNQAKYMNNLMQGVDTPYIGGTAAGTTNY